MNAGPTETLIFHSANEFLIQEPRILLHVGDMKFVHRNALCLGYQADIDQEFPYLTITEAMDVEAGVTFSARHCFMLETISINVKPKVHMTGPGYEISLRDDLWPQLLDKGKIRGDERWLVGENMNDEVVILHFDRGVRDAI
jgi:hypothetical protein